MQGQPNCTLLISVAARTHLTSQTFRQYISYIPVYWWSNVSRGGESSPGLPHPKLWSSRCGTALTRRWTQLWAQLSPSRLALSCTKWLSCLPPSTRNGHKTYTTHKLITDLTWINVSSTHPHTMHIKGKFPCRPLAHEIQVWIKDKPIQI